MLSGNVFSKSDQLCAILTPYRTVAPARYTLSKEAVSVQWEKGARTLSFSESLSLSIAPFGRASFLLLWHGPIPVIRNEKNYLSFMPGAKHLILLPYTDEIIQFLRERFPDLRLWAEPLPIWPRYLYLPSC